MKSLYEEMGLDTPYNSTEVLNNSTFVLNSKELSYQAALVLKEVLSLKPLLTFPSSNLLCTILNFRIFDKVMIEQPPTKFDG